MNDRTRVLAAVGVTVLLFLGVQLGALALVEPFHDADRQAVENPDDPTNSLVYFAIILVATAFMLAAFKYDVQWLIRGMVVGVSVMLGWFVFAEVIPPAVTVGGVNALAAVAALGIGAALVVYPEWYVIDAAGVVMGAGAAGLFGISFGLLPALLFLTGLAVYDAISVYKTRHMLSLAEGVMDLKVPVVLVVPTTLSYSYLETGSTDGVIEGEGNPEPVEANGSGSGADAAVDVEGEHGPDANAGDGAERGENGPGESDELERDAFFVGLGDAVIPTILVASAAYFLEEAPALAVPVIALNVPALGALVGTLVGLLALMYMVLQGKPHAGLPLLNGGAIGGYLIASVASNIPLATAIGL